MATPRRPQIEQMLVFDWSELKTRARIALFGPLEALGAAGRGRLRVRPRSAPVAPGLDGADEGLIPLGDLGGALVADLARLDAHRGVRKASPAGGSPSSAARAAPAQRGAQPVEWDSHLPCRDACKATCAAERPKSFATPRKRSGTLSGTSLSGARSTNTLDMLPPGHHAGPTHPWTRPDAQTRPPGSTYAAQGLVHAPRPTERAAVATTTRLPLRPSSPALFPRATGRVRSGLAALPPLGYPSSRATAGAGVECRAFLRRRLLVRAVAALVVGPSSSSCPIRRRAPVRPRPSRVLSWLSLRLPSPISLPSIPPCAAANRLLA